MRGSAIIIILLTICGCASTVDYTWQDLRLPARDDATFDLEECRVYAARQYQPGKPFGEPFLKDQAPSAEATDASKPGEWRPDRSPFPTTNLNAQPIHDIPVDYTGYPGELDYHPGYLDDILEKCMLDRGWAYRPSTAK